MASKCGECSVAVVENMYAYMGKLRTVRSALLVIGSLRKK